VRFLSALTLVGLLLAAPHSWASGGHSDAAKKSEVAADEPIGAIGAPRAPSVDMPILVAPVVVNGEMDHYVYLGVTLKLVDDTHKSRLLEKIPYLQDAFLREVHGPSIAHNNDPSLVDEKALIGRLLRVCAQVVGANIVKDIEFRNTARATN